MSKWSADFFPHKIERSSTISRILSTTFGDLTNLATGQRKTCSETFQNPHYLKLCQCSYNSGQQVKTDFLPLMPKKCCTDFQNPQYLRLFYKCIKYWTAENLTFFVTLPPFTGHQNEFG